MWPASSCGGRMSGTVPPRWEPSSGSAVNCPATRRAALQDRKIRLEVFDQEENYHTNTLFQYKAVLYHTGLLTSRGLDNLEDLDFSKEKESQMWVPEYSV